MECNNINKILFKKVKEYIVKLKETLKDAKTEHTDRAYLQKLLNDFNEVNQNPNITIQHEPRRNKEGLGSPDFLVKNNENTVGYIEVKKLFHNLDDTLKSSQIEKYTKLSKNILLTNYTEFIWIRNKEVTLREVLITKEELEKSDFKLDKDKVDNTIEIINEFLWTAPEKTRHIEELASLLAKQTRLLKEKIENNLKLNIKFNNINALTSTYNVLKKNIYGNNLSINDFADSISQTITYGFFIARLNNKENIEINFLNIECFIPSNFSLINDLLELIRNINKRSEFSSIKLTLEKLISIINNIDSDFIVKELSFTKNKLNSKDPYLYFYEDFLTKYDPLLRKAKGVYYTPHQVVSFIVNSLNEILKKEFNLNKGFANKEKVTVLDFATGTGTFLLEVIKKILKEIPRDSGKQQDYIKEHILKNIYGFEYLMAPYAVSHLKLSEYLKEICGVDFNNENTKLQIFLTNTLDLTDPPKQKEFEGFFPAISKENKLTNEVKNKEILIILGNPPYSAKSKNNSNYILSLMDDYKKINDESINEKSMASLNDDYTKFIRYSEYNFEKSKEGLLGIITNNGYLDNVTFRGMRYHLLKTFDEIYILNLHGSLRKKEKTDTGEVDENVFDIQTGVAISIFTKYKEKEKKNKLAEVYYSSIKGKKEKKYEFLEKNTIFSISLEKLEYNPPNYLFVKKDLDTENIYSKGKSLKDIFIEYSVGIKTHKDKIAIDYKDYDLLEKIKELVDLSEQDIRSKYNLEKDSIDWNLKKVIEFLKSTKIDKSYIKKIAYKPFDNRFVYYSKSKGVVARPFYNIMKHILEIENNISLFSIRTLSLSTFKHAFISNDIMDMNFFSGGSYIFPLYIKENQGVFKDIIKENFTISFRKFINTKYNKEFTPEEILGYIYSILYSNIYRNKFIEFLKIDFPKIIFVDNVDIFKKLSNFGINLINSYLLKVIPNVDSNIGKHTINLDKKQNKVIEKILYKENEKELYYNETSKFTNITKEVYEYTVGSYQVLKSYLKYRKNRELEIDEVEYLENVIKVIYYTINIQKEIDNIIQNLKEFNE